MWFTSSVAGIGRVLEVPLVETLVRSDGAGTAAELLVPQSLVARVLDAER
jgi:hypothetical protein